MTNTQQGLKIGAMLRHKAYRIERMLGQGGFGITYLATDLNLDRLVAIKEFFPKDYCDRESSTSHVTLGTQSASEFVNKLKAKFLKEARNIAKFDHPGIIKIHAAFEENNTAYYVMDYIEGESLSEMVKRQGPLSEAKALAYIKKIGKALEYVHSKRINHLDIKPANIMVRHSNDYPILIDFGLSKQYDSSGNQTSTTPTGISHGYAPMEQYNDGGVKEFSPQTDLYSLAATLYYILSGATPPQATKLIEDELTFPASIPTNLIMPISKAMSSKRINRHETINEFVREISGSNIKEETEIKKQTFTTKTKPESTPKSIPRPQPTPKHQPKDEPNSTITESPSKSKLFTVIGIAVAVIAVVIFALTERDGGDNPKPPMADSIAAKVVKTVDATPRVKDMYWDSPLGIASYTGEIMKDTLETGEINTIPNGKGIAKITSGEFKGCIYDGIFKNGKMEGKAHYTQSNGDTFVGTWKNNEYYEGRYTIKKTGEYFEGTFKNGDPYNGQWYNSKGEKTTEYLEETNRQIDPNRNSPFQRKTYNSQSENI